ncbi:hypothetical protein OIU78_008878 [Salix suchowensis]|nr:hypothetical protein OIU78_008878 [Salix suchowensis]
MQSLSTPSPIKSLIWQRSRVTRVSPNKLVLQCIYNSDSVSFQNGVGPNRADWQSSCAILASKVVAQQQSIDKSASGGDADGVADHVAAVNGHKTSVELNLVPIEKATSKLTSRQNPLSITDFCPPPMHGSQLRFEVAFQAVELWIADRAVLPVENSLGGSIHRNYDLLLRHRLHIVGEVQLPVHHCLLALPGVRKEYVKRVISHPQALAQCELTLTKLGLQVAREAVDDTAGAAEYIAANNLRDTAAIASARAAELYGMQILADGIQDDSSNVTRFVMLARDPIIPRTDRPFKTSIVFAHDKGTSVLFKVLSAFAFRNISLTKIESRPHRNRPIRLVDDANVGTAKHFEYMFYVDFEASMAEVRAQNALAEVQEFTSFLRVLGSYPMDMTPWCPSRGDDDDDEKNLF